MSRCAFNPTPEQRELVEAMIADGASEAEICRLVKNPATSKPISKKMLRKHFPAEITAGAVKVGPLINNWIVKTILGRGDIKDERLRVQLAICYAKTTMGQNAIVTHDRERAAAEFAEAEDDLDKKLARLRAMVQARETSGPSGGGHEEIDSLQPKPKHWRIG